MRRVPSCRALPNPRHPDHTAPPAARTPVMWCAPVMQHAPRVTLRPPLSCGAHFASCGTHPLSCCAQSQHPVMSVERFKPGIPGFRDCARNDSVEHSKPGVPGFRDYARNDLVETATTRCAPSCRAARSPPHAAQPHHATHTTRSCDAPPPCSPHYPVMRRTV